MIDSAKLIDGLHFFEDEESKNKEAKDLVVFLPRLRTKLCFGTID